MSSPCPNDLEGLKESILSSHASIHAFCKKYKGTVSRSTVYQVINGRYPGDSGRHIKKIKEILEGKLAFTEVENNMLSALKAVACVNCKKKGRKSCKRCSQLMLKQVKLLKVLFDTADKGE